MELTVQDLKVLIESVGDWQKKGTTNAMITSMLGASLAKSKEEGKEIIDTTFKKAKASDEERFEIATVLKAKLIMMKSSLMESNLTENGAPQHRAEHSR